MKRLVVWTILAASTFHHSRWLLSSAFSPDHSQWQQRRQTNNLATAQNGPLDDDDIQRRLFLRQLVASLSSLSIFGAAAVPTTPVGAAVAESVVRGPVELLRPATRVRLYIDRAVALCKSIQRENSTDNTNLLLLEPLVQYFEREPATFLAPDELKLSKRYLEIDTSSAWQAARLKEREARGAEIGIDYTTPYDRINTAIQQWGDKRQFQILRSRQRQLEESNPMRAAFNAYTNNLVFGDTYQLNVQGDLKKSMVRNNALPDVNSVVVSDLDLRDLYRNQVLQNIDNAKAELQYQRKTMEVDVGEILDCLLAAQASCTDWFGFIPKNDVEEALKEVLAEETTTSSLLGDTRTI